MGRRQDGLVHVELCKSSYHGLCQNGKVSKTCAPELLHSQRTGPEKPMWNTRHLLPHGQCLGPSPGLEPFHLPLSPGRQSRAGWRRSHLFTLRSCAVGCGPAGHVPGWAGDSRLPPPKLPLPMAGIAHQPAGANGKRAKVWTQTWSSCFHAKADFELAWRHVCVDITQGGSLPFNLSQPMELTSVWKTWDCSCCLVIQLKIFYFPPESLQNVCRYVCVSVRDKA